MIFFTADPHIGHTNILHLCHRDFPNVWEMKETLIRNHNSIVTDNDETWNLGDIGYKCQAKDILDYLARLNGKINIILGNHDKVMRQCIANGTFQNLFKSGKLEVIGLPVSLDPSISISKTIDIGDKMVYMSHYGTRTWPSAFRGTIHLYGHSHSNLPPLYKSMDVGVDTFDNTHTRYFPWSWNEIQTRMDNIVVEFAER